MKVRIVHQPTGCVDGKPWPKAGEIVELSDEAAEGMIATGTVEAVKAQPKVEKRPAPTAKVETRKKS